MAQPSLLGSKQSTKIFKKLLSKQPANPQEYTETPLSFLNDELVANRGICSPIEFLVVVHTLLYRHLATTLVHDGDRAVEIGTSYGHCTALFPCSERLGIDHAPEKIEEAARNYPGCRFVCGDVLNDPDLSWLDCEATVLFLDIGGGRDYKPVMKALAVCLPVMPRLRLVVAKSTEVVGFLSKFDDAVDTVARDLVSIKDDDTAVAEELASEIRCRGGEIPLDQVTSLRCGPRLRYLVGKGRMTAFLKQQAPVLELVKQASGADREMIRARPGSEAEAPLYVQMAVREELGRKVRKQLQDGEVKAW